MKSFCKKLFMGLGILPVVVMVAALLSRPAYSANTLASKAPHVLILVHIPTGKTQPVGLYSGEGCELERDALQAAADVQAPRQFFTACLPIKVI